MVNYTWNTNGLVRLPVTSSKMEASVRFELTDPAIN